MLFIFRHLKWLKKLEITNELYRETLNEYMVSYEEQEAKIEMNVMILMDTVG